MERSSCFINQFWDGIHSIILYIQFKLYINNSPSQYFARSTQLYTWCPLFAVSHCHAMEREASCKEHVCESCLFPMSAEFAIQVFSVYALSLITGVWKETAFYHFCTLFWFFFSSPSCMEEVTSTILECSFLFHTQINVCLLNFIIYFTL